MQPCSRFVPDCLFPSLLFETRVCDFFLRDRLTGECPRLLQLEMCLCCFPLSGLEVSLFTHDRERLACTRKNPPFPGKLGHPLFQLPESCLRIPLFPDLLCRSLCYVDSFLSVFLHGCQPGHSGPLFLPLGSHGFSLRIQLRSRFDPCFLENELQVGIGFSNGVLEFFGSLLERFFYPTIQLGLKQHLKDFLTLPGVRKQKPPKLPLRQHHHLPELVASEAEESLHMLRHALPLIGQHHAFILVGPETGSPPENRLCPGYRGPASSSFGFGLFGPAVHAIVFPT